MLSYAVPKIAARIKKARASSTSKRDDGQASVYSGLNSLKSRGDGSVSEEVLMPSDWQVPIIIGNLGLVGAVYNKSYIEAPEGILAIQSSILPEPSNAD